MRLILFLVLFLVPLSLTPAMAQKRVALVIGNSSYTHAPNLANAKDDAARLTRKLKKLGFEVVSGSNLSQRQFQQKINRFWNLLDGSDLALFYYAGHGIQVDGQNYIIPVDAQLESPLDLRFEAIPMSLILAGMETKVKTNLLFLDASYKNPFVNNLSRSSGSRSVSIGRGLAAITPGKGSLISFAAQPDTVAPIGRGNTSLYTAALLKTIGVPGESLSQSLIKAGDEVEQLSQGKQRPWQKSRLIKQVYLGEQSAKPATAIAPSISISSGVAGNKSTQEREFWQTVRSANSPELYKLYLERYPNGVFADFARLKTGVGSQTEPQKSTGLPGSTLPTDNPDDVSLVRAVQKQLNRLGCSAGRPDGRWGNTSRRALKKFGRFSKTRLASLEPSQDLLGALRGKKQRICPLICGKNRKNVKGQCKKITIKAKVSPKPAVKKAKKARAKPRQSTRPAKKQSRRKPSRNARSCYICRHTYHGWVRKICMTESERWRNMELACKAI